MKADIITVDRVSLIHVEQAVHSMPKMQERNKSTKVETLNTLRLLCMFIHTTALIVLSSFN